MLSRYFGLVQVLIRVCPQLSGAIPNFGVF